MKKFALLVSAAALVAGSVLAQNNPAPAPAAAPAAPAAAPVVAPDAVVLSAGGITVRRAEFEEAIKGLPQQYQEFALGPGKKQFAEDFLRMKLLAAEGQKAGLEKDPEVVVQLNNIRDQIIAGAQLKKMQEAVKVSDEDLKKTYETRKNEFEKVKARHILVAFKGSPAAQPGKPELTEEQAKAKAEGLRQKIETGAAKFEDLAKTDSDDIGSGETGGSLGEFGHGQMVPEFEQAAFATEIGKLSPVVRTQYGFHVIKVEERGFTPFEQAKASLEGAERSAKLQAETKKLVDDAKPTFNDAYFGK
jgi:parvulin-like peptidyl-prolyl isomerase